MDYTIYGHTLEFREIVINNARVNLRPRGTAMGCIVDNGIPRVSGYGKHSYINPVDFYFSE
jgi:hypothetical protein